MLRHQTEVRINFLFTFTQYKFDTYKYCIWRTITLCLFEHCTMLYPYWVLTIFARLCAYIDHGSFTFC